MDALELREKVSSHFCDLRSLEYLMAKDEFINLFERNPRYTYNLIRTIALDPNALPRFKALESFKYLLRMEQKDGESLAELRIVAAQYGVPYYGRMDKVTLAETVRKIREQFNGNDTYIQIDYGASNSVTGDWNQNSGDSDQGEETGRSKSGSD